MSTSANSTNAILSQSIFIDLEVEYTYVSIVNQVWTLTQSLETVIHGYFKWIT